MAHQIEPRIRDMRIEDCQTDIKGYFCSGFKFKQHILKLSFCFDVN